MPFCVLVFRFGCRLPNRSPPCALPIVRLVPIHSISISTHFCTLKLSNKRNRCGREEWKAEARRSQKRLKLIVGMRLRRTQKDETGTIAHVDWLQCVSLLCIISHPIKIAFRKVSKERIRTKKRINLFGRKCAFLKGRAACCPLLPSVPERGSLQTQTQSNRLFNKSVQKIERSECAHEIQRRRRRDGEGNCFWCKHILTSVQKWLNNEWPIRLLCCVRMHRRRLAPAL